MPKRKKILIIEHDDFLREILGNLLHKNNFYIKNGSSIHQGVKNCHNKSIDIIILGTSCRDFEDRKTINYIKKNINPHLFLILNHTKKKTGLVPTNQEFFVSDLSIEKIIHFFLKKINL